MANIINNYYNFYSFPGGLSESSDLSLVHTALRETEEELGVDQNRWDIWGELPPLPNRVKGVSCNTKFVQNYLIQCKLWVWEFNHNN